MTKGVMDRLQYGKCSEIWKKGLYEKDHISNIGDDSWNVIGDFW